MVRKQFGIIVVFLLTCGNILAKEPFTAQVVENLVQNEIARKMPAAVNRGTKRGKSLTGVHLKAATDAINKLVDESIVDRVQEAEKEVSQMLLKSIEHHIQDAGKVLLKQDENQCRDKLESCDQLAAQGVCETSKDAMVVNCPNTCSFCEMLDDLRAQSEKDNTENEKSEKVEKSSDKKEKKKSNKKITKKIKKEKKISILKHKKAEASLAPEEFRLIHQNMLDQAIDHANLPMAVSNEATTHPADTLSIESEYEKDRKNAIEEKAEQEAQEAEVEKLAAEEHEKEIKEQKKESQRAQRKKHKLALKKAKEAKEAKLNAMKAVKDAATAKEEAKKAEKEAKQAKNAPVPMASATTAQGNLDINPAMESVDTYPIGIPGGTASMTNNNYQVNQFMRQSNVKKTIKDITETDIINRDKNEENTHKKTGVATTKKKTDAKLKHEIESMVDKAFGELLL